MYRLAVSISATNDAEINRCNSSSVTELAKDNGLALLTGVRACNKLRGTKGAEVDIEAFRSLICETQKVINDNRLRNNRVERLQDIHTNVKTLYDKVRKAMDYHARVRRRKAYTARDRLAILHPDTWMLEREDAKGPVEKWKKAWVNTEWATSEGSICMPKSILSIPGNRVIKLVTPWGWQVHPGLWFAWFHYVKKYTIGTVLDSTSSVHITPHNPENVVVAYMDGAYDQSRHGGDQKAGFGFVAVTGGGGSEDKEARALAICRGQVQTDPHSPAYIGAVGHTNNTGELSALGEAIRWLLEEDPDKSRSILLRPDSEYAMGVAIGDNTPSANKKLAEWVVRMYGALKRQRKGKVRWLHVKGHSEHKWNDVVDNLATAGAEGGCFSSSIPGKAWRKTRLDGELQPHKTRVGCGVIVEIRLVNSNEGRFIKERILPSNQAISPIGNAIDYSKVWRAWAGNPPQHHNNLACMEVNECERIIRSSDELGILNLDLNVSLTDLQVKQAWKEALDLVSTDDSATEIRKVIAREKLRTAAQTIGKSSARNKIIRKLSNAPPIVTHETWCPIDLKALRDFIASPESLELYSNSDGTARNGTYREAATNMINAISTPPPSVQEDVTWVKIKWKYSRLAERLIASGHVQSSREYAIGFDPFKGWGRKLRHLALRRFGFDFDDAAAYSNASLFFIEVNQSICKQYLDHKDLILKRIGRYYFPSELEETQRERAKQLIHRLDMEGSLEGWLRDWQIQGYRNAGGCSVRLPEGGGTFNLLRYVEAQQSRTEWIAQKRPRMLKFIQVAKPNARHRGTLRSYILQEYEARSRDEKLRVAESMGHSWISLQHDGVVIGLRTGTVPQTFANTLTTYISNILGYHQKVEVKDMIPNGPPIELWEWNNDKKHVCEIITELETAPHTQAFREWLQAANPNQVETHPTFTYESIALTPLCRGESARHHTMEKWTSTTKLTGLNMTAWDNELWETYMRLRRGYINLEMYTTTPPPRKGVGRGPPPTRGGRPQTPPLPQRRVAPVRRTLTTPVRVPQPLGPLPLVR